MIEKPLAYFIWGEITNDSVCWTYGKKPPTSSRL